MHAHVVFATFFVDSTVASITLHILCRPLSVTTINIGINKLAHVIECICLLSSPFIRIRATIVMKEPYRALDFILIGFRGKESI